MAKAEPEILSLIELGETLTVEFKSDTKGLSDKDLVAAVVGMANTDGGQILLGVEDDGSLSGLHATHRNLTGLPALIYNKTNPSLSVLVDAIEVSGKAIGRISVPKAKQLIATSDGVVLRRRIKLDGTPEAIPLFPHEFIGRQSALGIADPSAAVLEVLTESDLNPLQRVRLRNAIKRYGGEQALLPLADDELDGALGLCRTIAGVRHPTVTGLLLLGTEDQLRQYLPSHEAAFQVLVGTDVKVNEFYRTPLLEIFEEMDVLFKARVEEEEIQVGLFRVPVPNYDRRAIREALVNAMVHRDYSRLGAVHVKITDDGLSISNPGGFVDGVTLGNLLVADPRSRNPLLADVIKRIGLAERTGRGIDRIYEGMLRYGRPAPDYSLSNQYTVSLQMFSSKPDFDFVRMVVEQGDKIGGLSIDALIVLSRLRDEKRLAITDLAPSVQKSELSVRGLLEKLVEDGLVEPHGSTRGRTYTLSAALYRRVGKKAEYVRQAGFASIQQEQMVMSFIDKHGSIKRTEVIDLCLIGPYQATRLLKKLAQQAHIKPEGQGRGTRYTRS